MIKIVALTVSLCLLAGTAPAAEQENAADNGPATFVGTVFHGVGMGAYTGLAWGWVRYADHGQMQEFWESAGYGALAGLGVGLGAAIAGPDGTGDLVLTDIEQGAGLGSGVGFFWGIVSALFTGDSSRVGDGLAWGQLAGVAVGMGYAGFRIARGGYSDQPGGSRDDTAIQCFFVPDGGRAAPYVCMRKRF
jgi:hypothetical protein